MSREAVVAALLQDSSFTFSGLDDMTFTTTKGKYLYDRRMTLVFYYPNEVKSYTFSIIKGMHILYLCIDVLADRCFLGE
ncbi:MAG: hypothetical protein EOM76_08700 [Sphingobacteriia bacterium]|nr:hypothetical protein [Sphingobacteriia bacterium]